MMELILRHVYMTMETVASLKLGRLIAIGNSLLSKISVAPQDLQQAVLVAVQ